MRTDRSPPRLRRLYRGLAPLYEWVVPWISSRARTLGRTWLDVTDGDRVLDVGTGPGRSLRALAAATPSGWVDGIDLTPAMAARARRRLAASPYDRYRVRVGRATALPYPDDAYDAVVSSYMVDVLPASDIGAALREMRRVLRPEGRLVLVHLSPPVHPVERAWAGLARRGSVLLGGARPIALAEPVRRAGFSIEATAARTQLGLRSGLLRARPKFRVPP
jgi:demethylmenaquinone methyltransferase/2-methoxy-6-polyprenyl-1,4-benzoquinol methylase